MPRFFISTLKIISLVSLLSFSTFAFTEEHDSKKISQEKKSEKAPRFESFAKGLATYRQFETFENVATTTPFWKKSLDLNYLELKGEYKFGHASEIEFEVEFEHGGTGSSIEYDPLEEYGEFESETEKGGEVVISELYYKREFSEDSSIKIGKFPVFISLVNVQESPLLYPGILASTTEGSLLPAEWREIGMQYHHKWGDIGVRAALISGLNSEFFRKYNWVGGGYQKRLETVNADDLAGNLGFEYGDVAYGNGVGAALYYGNTSGNRNKRNKLEGSANLMIASIFGRWQWDRIGLRGQVIRGQLDNSDKVSQANVTLPAKANPGAFSSLGHKAELEMIEFSYRLMNEDETQLTAYVGYEHSNSMASVQGNVLADDRYDQLASNLGLMWVWDTAMFAKVQYVKHSNKMSGMPDTDEYLVGFGFDLKAFDL